MPNTAVPKPVVKLANPIPRHPGHATAAGRPSCNTNQRDVIKHTE